MNFSKEKFSGEWFEIYRDENTWYEPGDKQCVTNTFNLKDNGDMDAGP